MAGLVAGLALKDVHLVGRAMRDVVVEPYRKQFIPGFDALREKVMAAGALAFNISGAGPSVFALSADMDVAARVGEIMRQHFAEQAVASDVYVCKVSNRGARVIE